MIELLARYARDHELTVEPGFLAKAVRWAILCDRQGRLLGVLELGEAGQKGNTGQEFGRCPHLEQPELVSGKEDRSHFLIEAASVAVLFKVDPNDAKTRRKHQHFLRLLREASEAMPELGAIADVLGDAENLAVIAAELDAGRARPSDKVTFAIDGSYVVESEAWHDWWRESRKPLAEPNKAEGAMRSVISGQLVRPVFTMPKTQGLGDVGGHAAGDALICFDKDAFGSYALPQSTNAALSEAEAWALRAGLNDLLAKHGQRLCGMRAIHWFDRQVAPADDALSWLEVPPEQQELQAQARAAELLQSIRSGKRPDLAGNYYYALALSGATGRVMVRDWIQGQFEDLVDSVRAWFSHLEITAIGGAHAAKAPGIERVVTSLLLPKPPGQKYGDWVKPLGAERLNLWRAALRKDPPIPYSALARLVMLNSRFHQTGQLEDALKRKPGDRERIRTLSLLYARMGLMKAYHIRRGDPHIMPGLNRNHPHPAYHCGRLMAVLADLQRAALGNVGAGVVQRYYAAASSTPALVLGRLTRTSMFHLGKLDAGIAHWFDGRIADVWVRIGESVPRVLGLEEQSLFALGYYHQLAENRRKKEVKEVLDEHVDDNITEEDTNE